MEYCSFVVSSGKNCIILPVFSCFAGAEEMNRFYSRAAGVIFDSGERITQEKFTRYCCTFSVEEGAESDGGTVRLNLSYSRRGERTKRKTIEHVWKNGYIVQRNVSG